jgi:hypothetical protein
MYTNNIATTHKEREMSEANFETVRVQMAHVRAMDAAVKAAQQFSDQHFGGRDGGPCGFAWVDVFKVRSNSKLGKALQTVGFQRSYTGGLQLWNKWWRGQSIDAAEHGAYAYAAVMQQELGIEKIYAGSRLD